MREVWGERRTPEVEQDLERGLDELRESLRADGADMELEAVRGGVAYVRLVLGPDACRECIAPRDVLQRVLVVALRKYLQDLTGVELLDPREKAAG